MHQATVTRRISIRWGEESPQENTSTIVMTSPKGLFIDIRVLLDHSDSDQTLASVDWAFAGQANRITGGCSWDHWIDSRSDTPHPDTGTFQILPNGDELERGSMPNESGIVTSYEEIWRNISFSPDITLVFVCYLASALKGESGPHRQPYDKGTRGAIGMVVRIGDWCQGLLKWESSITAQRWLLQDTKWKQTFARGDILIPCLEVCQLNAHGVEEGLLLKKDTFVWECVERKVGKLPDRGIYGII